MTGETAIGIDLGGTNLRGAVVDVSGSVLYRTVHRTPRSGGSEAVVEQLVDLVAAICRHSVGEIESIGIGAPGPLNMRTGKVSQMPNIPGFESFPLQEVMHQRTGKLVRIINDADASAIGEYHNGAAREWPFFGLFTLGTGLGSSVMLDGSPWIGIDSFSPELGHIPIFESEERCGCSGIGHAEARLSSRGLITDYVSRIASHNGGTSGESITVRHLFDAGRRGDAIAAQVIERYGVALGRVIATAAVCWNLRHFVINGGISDGWELLEGPVRNTIRKCGFGPMTDGIVLHRGTLGDDAGLIGAGLFVLDRRFHFASNTTGEGFV